MLELIGSNGRNTVVRLILVTLAYLGGPGTIDVK